MLADCMNDGEFTHIFDGPVFGNNAIIFYFD